METLPDGQPLPEYEAPTMLMPEGLDIGAPVTAAGANASETVELGSVHTGTEIFGNMPARTDTGRRMSSVISMLSRIQQI